MPRPDRLTPEEKGLLHARTTEFHRQQTRKADHSGVSLPYDALDLRELARSGLGMTACPYCRGPVLARDFCLEPRTPVCRGGKFTLANLTVCCSACRDAKGALDDEEFRALSRLMELWPRPVRTHFLARLRAGAARVPADLPEPGSLEWFTGTGERPDIMVGSRANRKLYRDLRGVLRHEDGSDSSALGQPGDGGAYAI